MTISRLRFIRPNLPPISEWAVFLKEAYAQKWFTNFGPVNDRFETELTEYFDFGRAAVTASSATSGLTMALQALGVRGPVVIPSFTFVATAQAVLAAGCEPIFCDIDMQTLELSPSALEEIIQKRRPAAVISVRAYGFDQDQGQLADVAERNGVPLVIDAAAALAPGTHFVGRQGTMEVVSLHATKVLGIGEGGAIFAPAHLAPALRSVANFGLQDKEPVTVGTNAKMSEFHAAVGLAALRHLQDHVRRRRKVAARYYEFFCQIPGIEKCWSAETSCWQTYPLLLRQGARVAAIIAAASQMGLGLRRYYFPALHRTPAFSDAPHGPLTITDDVASRMLCLPVYSDMTDIEVAKVIEIMVPLLQGSV